ncbi:MAG: hypothetical protein EBS51_14565, partial [Planctomycetia bacterium]|nr:hypothetical protein [Planctomycetia bacterium]
MSIAATDTSVIYSNAGGVGLGLKFGDQAGAVAVGAAYGKNEITNGAKARIEKATVTAGKGVTIAATATPSIESVAYGVALSVAVAGGAISAAGSGASAYNTVRNTVDAAILSATVTTWDDVAVRALDKPQITTKAGAGALAVAIGKGVAIAPGVVVAESSVTDTVTARIGRADGSDVDPTVTSTAGALTVQATSEADVSSLGVAVAASVAVGKATGAFAGAGARGTVTFASTITAEIDAGTVSATDVTIAAVDRDQSEQNTIGTGGLAIGVIGGSIGVSLTETTAKNTVSARIGAAGVTAMTGGITIDVRGGHSLAAETVVTSVAVAIGGSGAGGHAFATDTSTYRATVATGSRLNAQEGLVVRARGSSDDASAPDGRLDAEAHGGVAGLVAVGVVIAKATDGTRREATIGDGVDLSGVGSLGLFATSSPIVQARSTAVDVGGVAVTVNQSVVTTAGTAKAATGAGVTLPLGDVQIMASGSSRLDASQTGIVAGLLAAGATQTTGESGLATEAVLGADTRTAADRTGSLVVRATSQDVTTIAATAGSGGLFAGFGTTGELSDTTTTRATILGGTIHAGTVDLGVDRLNRYDIDVDSVTITIAAGVGITRATF